MLPLAGIKVIEVAQNLSGPYAAEILATLGAETGKVAEDSSDDYSAPLSQLGKLLIKMGNALSR